MAALSFLVGNFSWILIDVHWGFQVKCLSRNWECLLRNGDGLGVGCWEIHRREESKVFYQELLSSQRMGTKCRGPTAGGLLSIWG